MRKKSSPKEIPPPLELECLKVLWALGEGSVKDVREQMTKSRELAYTTVMTILDRLAKKEIVSRKKLGRAFVYVPLVDRECLRRVAIKELLDTYFDGDSNSLASWLRVPISALPVQPLESNRQQQSESNLDTSLL